ncbi:MAG: hypothetical protein ABWK01_08010, partial [Infirmifilum sp.]
MKKKIIGLVTAALILLALFLAATPRHPSQLNAGVEVPTTVAVQVQVVRNGKVVATYEKVGDPLLYNFWALLLNSFLGRYYNSPLTIYKTDGTTFTQPEWEWLNSPGTTPVYGNPLLAIGYGTSSQAVSFYDYQLGGYATLADVPSTGYNLVVNSSHMVVQATASFTVSTAVTVNEVGLY